MTGVDKHIDRRQATGSTREPKPFASRNHEKEVVRWFLGNRRSCKSGTESLLTEHEDRSPQISATKGRNEVI